MRASLCIDTSSCSDWAEDMAGPGGQRTSLTSGLLQFNLEVLRSTLLPITCKAYSGYMSKLSSSLTVTIKDLRKHLDKYISMLKQRPSDLESYVQFIEETYQHLDDDGDLRLAVRTSKDQIGSLYEILLAAVPQTLNADSRSPSGSKSRLTSSSPPPPRLTPSVNETSQCGRQPQDAAAIATLSAATDGMIGANSGLQVTNVTARDARPVFQQWKQAQADIIRYEDECIAAREFYESSSALMASHLKVSLAQMESESFTVLFELRMEKSTSSSVTPAKANDELSFLAKDVASLKSQLTKFHAWMKLFGNQSGVKPILQETELMISCAASKLQSRTAFWLAVSRWERALDQLYSLRCFKRPGADDELMTDDSDSEEEEICKEMGRFALVTYRLELRLNSLEKEVLAITVILRTLTLQLLRRLRLLQDTRLLSTVGRACSRMQKLCLSQEFKNDILPFFLDGSAPPIHSQILHKSISKVGEGPPLMTSILFQSFGILS